MLKKLSKRSGNRYTLFSVILIILMVYAFKFSLGSNAKAYHEYVYYGDVKYEYSQMVQESSLRFVRKYGKDYEGYVLLLKKSEKNLVVPDNVYIYEGWGKYREYKVKNY